MTDIPHLTLITIPHREIAPSKTQPRTHFAPEKMAEQKAGLEAHGFLASLSHLLVRPFEYRWETAHDPRNGMAFEVRTHETSPWQRVRVRFDIPFAHEPGAPAWAKLENEEDIHAALQELPKFEIVDGERRWRNSGELIAEGKLAEDLPAVIEPMSDARALELQLLNVLQREGLTPMEEAEGIVRLLEMKDAAGDPIYTRSTLAVKLGCSEQHVGNYVKIGRLRGTAVGEALEAGKLTEKHARILAGVPAGKARDELTRRVLAPGGPMPTALLERTIRDEFQVELRGADFDTEDPNLVPVEFEEGYEFENEHRTRGGACGDCPFNSRNEEGWEARRQPMCRNLECFRLKTELAHRAWMVSVDQREERWAALSIEEAMAVFDQRFGGTRLAFNSGYVELDAAPDESELKSEGGVKVQAPGNWRKLIKGQGVPVFFAKDTAGKVHEIAKRDAAQKAAHLNGYLIFKDSAKEQRLDEEPSATAEDGGQKSEVRDEEREAETLARKAEQERARALHNAEIGAVVFAAEKRVRASHVTLPTGAWTVMVLALAEVLEDYGALTRVVFPRRKIQPALIKDFKPGWFAREVESWTMAAKVGFVVEALIALSIDESEPSDMEVWADAFGADLRAARKAVKAAARSSKSQAPNPKEAPNSKSQKPEKLAA